MRALAFDVFGTVVDWRGSIIREGELLSATKGLQVDWPAFADAWRAGYAPAMDRTRAAGAEWLSLDVLHRQILDSLLPRFGLSHLSEAELAHLNRAWHRLSPWPDTVGGLNRLRSRYIISTLSNGNVSLLVDMAKNAGLPWDCVLSAELAHKYKPDPEAYLTAARLLDVAPNELMLVAAHPSDLRAAQGVACARPMCTGRWSSALVCRAKSIAASTCAPRLPRPGQPTGRLSAPMDTSAAGQVLWVRAVETTAQPAWTEQDAEQASRSALQAVGSSAPAEDFIVQRARTALQRMAQRAPALATDRRRTCGAAIGCGSPWAWGCWPVCWPTASAAASASTCWRRRCGW